MADDLVYCSLDGLVDLQRHSHSIDLSARQAMQHNLPGPRASQRRGRGLDFEELRDYRVGDDIRALDWKVTNRTRKPHVRVHSEELERDVVLVVDQRESMFFGSQNRMKSVTAAQAAAVLAWRALSLKDRVGALLFNDQSTSRVKPQRSRKGVMQVLQSLVQLNHDLRLNNDLPLDNDLDLHSNARDADQLLKPLCEADQQCAHDCLVILISDLSGWSRQSFATLKRIKSRNELLIFSVYNPLELELPSDSHKQWLLSNGELQFPVDTSSPTLREAFSDSSSQQLELIERDLRSIGVTLQRLTTEEPVADQLRGLLGAGL